MTFSKILYATLIVLCIAFPAWAFTWSGKVDFNDPAFLDAYGDAGGSIELPFVYPDEDTPPPDKLKKVAKVKIKDKEGFYYWSEQNKKWKKEKINDIKFVR